MDADFDPNQREDVPFPNQFGGRNPNLSHLAQPQGQTQPRQPTQQDILQQAAQILQNAGYDIAPNASQAAVNGNYGQMPPAAHAAADFDESGETETDTAKDRLDMLAIGFQNGLNTAAQYTLEVAASYKKQFVAGTGRQITLGEAMAHIVAAVNSVV